MQLFLQALPAFLQGTLNTLLYCISSFPLALLLGLLLAFMSSSRLTWFKIPARTFIEIFRGTPMIAQIFIIYYAVGAFLGNYAPTAKLVNAWTAGIAALALNYAAYEAEVFRAGFLSVDRGQTEAALSLGLTPRQNFFRVVLPQAIPLMIPPFVNDFIYMLKDSAIVSVISGTELTSVLTYWTSRNESNSMLLYAMAMILYLVLSLPTSYVARLFERRLRMAL
jgi:His/Glu/Gln/Arg/opine family amino acid ABC transporter permease subunit